jgi:UPF0271 protein
MGTQEIEDVVLYQVAALAGIAAAEGARLRHVKPHGALYNMAAKDERLAQAVASGVVSFDRSLVMVGLPGSALLSAAASRGLRVASEAFADRAYRSDGSLVPRHVPGAIIHDPEAVVARVIRIATAGEVVTIDGSTLTLKADTICVHGDTPQAASISSLLRKKLSDAGVTVEALR